MNKSLNKKKELLILKKGIFLNLTLWKKVHTDLKKLSNHIIIKFLTLNKNIKFLKEKDIKKAIFQTYYLIKTRIFIHPDKKFLNLLYRLQKIMVYKIIYYKKKKLVIKKIEFIINIIGDNQ